MHIENYHGPLSPAFGERDCVRNFEGQDVPWATEDECVGDKYADHYLLDELVCAAFHGIPKDVDVRYLAVLHADRNGANPAASNLRWVVLADAVWFWAERQAFDTAQNKTAALRKKKQKRDGPHQKQQRETKIMVGTNPLPVMQPLKTALEDMEETA